jgi:hypothetical protein
MKIRLQQYTIESTRSVNGKVISRRYGYVIAVKRHWWKVWGKWRYINLLPGWQRSILHDEAVRVRLVSMSYATKFNEDGSMDLNKKSTAENVIKLMKEQPDRFILA